MAKERVKSRVAEGGHNIEAEIIERRYYKGIKNLFDIYLPIVDGALIIDNSNGKRLPLAKMNVGENLKIIDETKFNKLKTFYDNFGKTK